MSFMVYIHGFNSGAGSRSGKALEHVTGQSIFCPQNDYSRPFDECLNNLQNLILKTRSGKESIILLGTSLGGFYAMQLRLPNTKQVIAWNPVIYPAIQLANFTGENTRFTDNVKWHFSRTACLSYAQAPDPRVWPNEMLQKIENMNSCNGKNTFPVPERNIIIGTQDDLLDHELGFAYWRGHAKMLEIDAAHHIENFEHVLGLLK